MPADPNRVEAIFAVVLAKTSPEERASYIDEACAGDVELRQRVEALLKAYDDAGSFLQSPAAREGITTDPPAAPRIDPSPQSPPAEGVPARASDRTSCCNRSARAAWALSSWPSGLSPSVAWSL